MTSTPGCLMSPREHDLLRQVARGKLVLEMGAWEGETTVLLAEVAARVWTVDHHRGDRFVGLRDTLARYFVNVAQSGREDRVVSIVGDFRHVLPYLSRDHFGVVLVDGAHDYDSIQADVVQALALVSREGVIAVHDWGRWEVAPACRALLGAPYEVVDSLALWRTPR